MAGESVGAGIAGRAVDDLLGGADTAGHPSAAGFLSAPLDDAIGEQDAGAADDESAVAGAALVNGAACLGAAAPAATVTVPALDDVAVAESVEAAVAKEGGNLGAAGEPSDAGARRTDVTETLAANALVPAAALAPEMFTAQARAASAAWDAAEAVTEIYTGHYNQLVRLAVLLVHDVQTAEEVVQDAFEAMHLAWRRLRDSEKALSYLRQTVVNRSRSVLRHRKVVDMHAPKPAPDEPSAEHGALALLERSAVAAALRSLPLRQREAIVLRYYADFSEADIAAAMGISRGAVKSHTARAMAALKSILEQET